MPNPENIEPYQFKPGESGNPSGRPRKMVSQVLKELGKKGIENVTKEQVRATIEVLMNCSEEDISEIAKDRSQSVLFRIIAVHLSKSLKNDRVFNMLLDRAFGKPDQKTEHSGGIDINKPDLSKLTDAELRKIAEIQRKVGISE